MLLKQLLLGVIGISGGMLVSGGVFTVLVAVGLVSRFAGRTHTADHIFLYETIICLGTITGCIISVFSDSFGIGTYIVEKEIINAMQWVTIGKTALTVFGLFAGMFVGCFAIAIAEMLDAIPIFSRRVGFRHGLGIALLAIAIGKVVGSLIYFSQHIFLYGGL